MEYNFKEIESKWQHRWQEEGTYRVEVDPSRPKYYVLDMFPYPSGAGLHVGHPLGYIASDIYARYKRLRGFNVLHPMGYDAFGLPAEQYAIQTGQHPAVTTERNTARYREQLDKIGFSFDWSREVRTCDPKYYKWTQWAFLRMFDHWYDRAQQKARPIAELTAAFAASGTEGIDAACTHEMSFTADEWNGWDEARREQVLQNYRLAYRADTMVNWCPKLGTVLANDEVRDGLSVRGGYPVEQKRMKQWLLRVTAYAERMLEGLEHLAWSDSLKEIQRNWIGRSVGAQVFFDIAGSERKLEIFTTRPDTIFGVTFIDHDNRLVVNGSRFDRAFSANNFERLFAQAGEETRNTEKENLPANPKRPERIPDRRPQRSDTAGKWLLFDLVDTLLDEAAAPDLYEEYEMIQKRRKRKVQN